MGYIFTSEEFKLTKKDILSKLLFEGKSYRTYEDIEMLVEVESDLSMVPIQPLYISLLASPTDQIALILPKLSKRQRQAFIDLDLWVKDKVDVNSFEYWIEVYSKVKDLALTQNFVSSEDFLLYLKSRVNIHTFDTEDPMYPDHDYYFLTDDMLLLIEYSEDYRYPHELKYLIRNLYDKFGVENAYTMLFKLVNDSFAVLQEEVYQQKKGRLRELGFVDYYDALEQTHDFLSVKQIENFIIKKVSLTPNLDIYAKNQSLHGSALVSFDQKMDSLFEELAKVENENRLSFLQFTFLRLVNSTITLNDALRGGSTELTRIGSVTKSFLELGLEMVKKHFIKDDTQSNIFDKFDFFDIYRVGKSLIQLEKNRIKKSLKKTPFEENDYEYFVGAWWGSFLENSDFDVPKVKTFGAGLHTKRVNNLQSYDFWKKEVDLFISSIPFINSFFEMLNRLKLEGKLHDQFYLNYDVENIDFESILISSFINFTLGYFSGTDVNKMGVTISELKVFFKNNFLLKDGEYIIHGLNHTDMKDQTRNFITLFGLDQIEFFEIYLHGILSEHLSGYDFDSLSDEDFKHIGGPILLNSLNEN